MKITAFSLGTLLFIFSLSITFPALVSASTDLKLDLADEYRLKGYEAQKNGDLDQALGYFIKSAELGTPSASSYNDIGVLYEQMGDLDRAQEYYEKAIEKDSQYLAAYSNLGYLAKNRGDYNKAAECFQKRFSEGSPSDPWTDKARDELSTLSQKLPHLRKWLIEREVHDLNQEINRRAQIAFYNRVNRAQEHFQRGQSFELQNKYSDAMEQYARALELTPDNIKIVQAQKKLRVLMTREKTQGHTDMALQLLENGDTASARMELRRALATIPKEPTPYLE